MYSRLSLRILGYFHREQATGFVQSQYRIKVRNGKRQSGAECTMSLKSVVGALRGGLWDAAKPSSIWIHAASLGETKSILPLLVRIKRDRPDLSVIVTNRSARAYETPIPEIDALISGRFLAPLEFRVDEFLSKVQPCLAVLVESELWPWMIHRAKQRGARLALVNARLSTQAFNRWTSTSPTQKLLRSTLRQFSIIHAQDEISASRIKTVLQNYEPIAVGSLKPEAARLHAQAGNYAKIASTSPLIDNLTPGWSAISVHPGETEELIHASRVLKQSFGMAVPLIIVPRHPQTQDILRRIGDEDIYVAEFYGIVEHIIRWTAKGQKLVFIGGSLPSSIHKGGHNIWEPLVAGCRVMHGPHFDAFSRDLEIIPAYLRDQVSTGDEIASAVHRHFCSLQDVKANQSLVCGCFESSRETADVLWESLRQLLPPASRSTVSNVKF